MDVEGGRDADRHEVALGDAGEVDRRLEPALRDEGGEVLLDHVPDVVLPCVDLVDLRLLDVEADGPVPSLRFLDGEGEADVAEADRAANQGSLCYGALNVSNIHFSRFLSLTSLHAINAQDASVFEQLCPQPDLMHHCFDNSNRTPLSIASSESSAFTAESD